MGLRAAIRSVLRQYATFSGRASRGEYWWWFFALILLMLMLRLLDGVVIAPTLGFQAFAKEAGAPLSMLATLLLFLPNLAVCVRRLHDIDKSGWWILLGFIPLLGGLVLLYFLIQPGDERTNRFNTH
ncbi:MAG: DUF805 domain-containing protein [Pseudomonadota bacterium]